MVKFKAERGGLIKLKESDLYTPDLLYAQKERIKDSYTGLFVP